MLQRSTTDTHHHNSADSERTDGPFTPPDIAGERRDPAYDRYLDDLDFGMLVAADAAFRLDSHHWNVPIAANHVQPPLL